MKYFCKILLLFLLFNFNVSLVCAEPIAPKINPEWIKYNDLNNKENFYAIPEKFIYNYESNVSILEEKTSLNYSKLDAVDNYPTYFNLTNYNGKNYVNPITKDQKSLGLCWVFSTLGSMESNMLLNGVDGASEYSSKCDSSNSTSKYCSVKNDLEQNINYSKGLVDSNVTFSERNIDYKTSSPYYSINEQYNYFYDTNNYNFTRSLGEGGHFLMYGELSTKGDSPSKFDGDWQSYNENLSKKSLNSIFNKNSNYIITEYYQYPLQPTSSSSFDLWINDLKKLITTYGAAYVSTIAPQQSTSGSCYYSDYNNSVDLINYDRNCGISYQDLGWHAMQIIGWDDNYSYSYCKISNYSYGTYSDSSSCKTAGGSWVSGTGAWILKNSWGNTSISKPYPYLAYKSFDASIFGVKKVSVNDNDNVYNVSNSNYNKQGKTETLNGKTYYSLIYEFQKSNNDEYIKRVNYKSIYENLPYIISVSNDGINYTKIGEGTTDYSGSYTFDVNDYLSDNNKIYVKILEAIPEGYYDDSLNYESFSVFTINECTKFNNCDNNININTSMDSNNYKLGNKSFLVNSKTKNINSGQQLNYKVYNSGNEDITSEFQFAKNYIINDSNIVNVSTTDTLPIDTYKLVSSYGGATDTYNFNIYNLLEVNYDTKYTNTNVVVNTNYNYPDLSSGSFVKLDYYINSVKNTKQFNNDLNVSNFDINVSKNGTLKLELYSCTSASSCNLLEEKTINISNIDKVKPTFSYNITNNNKTITFNYSDDKKMSDLNNYKFAISNSNTIVPTIFTNYINNTNYTVNINSSNKYLWIKNIYDEAGNKLCDNEYCIYEMEVSDNYYKVKYYDEDGITLLKEENYLEGTNFVSNYIPKKNEDHYYKYSFNYWENYEINMSINSDINLIAVYNKTYKVVESNVYKINNNFITNIFNNSISEKYLVSTFKSNIYALDINKFYNDSSIVNPSYLYTGLKYGIDLNKFIIVVSGDVTGDGLIKMNDVMKISSHIVNGGVLSQEYLLAGDVTSDGLVKMNDVMKISSKIVNGGSLK